MYAKGTGHVIEWSDLVRRFLPAGLRRWAASPLSGRGVWDVMARLSTRGFIRFNIAGRECQGIVAGGVVRELQDEIVADLRTLTDFDGCPCVEEIFTPAGPVGEARALGRFPDLIVTWKQRLAVLGRNPARRGHVRAIGQSLPRRIRDSDWRSGRAGAERRRSSLSLRRLPAAQASPFPIFRGPRSGAGQPKCFRLRTPLLRSSNLPIH